MSNIVFRADGGASIGYGHLMRCLTLAAEFSARGHVVRFLSRSLPGAPLDLITRHGFALCQLPAITDPEHDAVLCTAELEKQPAALLIVDSYALDAVWERRVRGHVSCLAAIDDIADRRHDCDVLIDQNLHQDPAARYVGLVAPGTLTLLGPRFALLRPEFARAREVTAPRRGRIDRIVVFYTGGDDKGETMKALTALAQWRADIEVDVVVGAAHPGRAEISAFCSQRGWHYHCQIDYMARLLAAADLVLGAGGSASWERCAVGAPALVSVMADNQREATAALEAYGAIRSLGWADALTSDDYLSALSTLDPAGLSQMSSKAWELADGAGAGRVCDALLAAAGLSMGVAH